MSHAWKDFKTLNTLSIAFANSLSKQATIFANGSNQVELLVTLSMQGLDDKPLEIGTEELKNALYLCNYRTGDVIEEPWIISFEENAYNRAISYQNVAAFKAEEEQETTFVEPRKGKLSMRFYVSCDTFRENMLFAVGISIPGVGNFDTTEDGTSTNNGPGGETGGPFKNPKAVIISLSPPINYSDISNIKLDVDDFVTLKTDVLRRNTHAFNNGPQCNQYHDITLQRSIVRIKPNTQIPNNRFDIHKATHPVITNFDAWDGSMAMGPWCKESIFHFKPLYPPEENSQVCAVMGRGANDNRYHVNFWFWEDNQTRLKGNFTLHHYYDRNEYLHYCTADMDEKKVPNNGEAILYVYKFVVPQGDASQKGWKNTMRESELFVADIYGNKGTLKVTFNDKEHFDVPHVF